jgi:hypothetical protein
VTWTTGSWSLLEEDAITIVGSCGFRGGCEGLLRDRYPLEA